MVVVFCFELAFYGLFRKVIIMNPANIVIGLSITAMGIGMLYEKRKNPENKVLVFTLVFVGIINVIMGLIPH